MAKASKKNATNGGSQPTVDEDNSREVESSDYNNQDINVEEMTKVKT